MKPNCPECNSNERVQYTGEDKLSESGELYYVKVYMCFDCHCEFDEEEISENEKPITEQWDIDEGDNSWCLPEDMGDK